MSESGLPVVTTKSSPYFRKISLTYIIYRANPLEVVSLDIFGVSEYKDSVDMLMKW